MPLKLEKKKTITESNQINNLKADLKGKNNKDFSKKITNFILFVMAAMLTLCSLYMVGITAFERSATKSEAFIIAGVAMCVALSAHLLPALVKGRQSIHVYSLISIIWLTCVSATLYSHTLFFVTTQNERADVRSETSPEIKNIQDLIDQKQKWISEQKSRSLNDINISIANETIRIDQLTPRDCDSCKTIKSRISSYQARKAAFEDEKKIAQNIEDEKAKVMQMQEEIMNKKDDKRTDAVFEKMSKIFPGMSYAAFNLSSSVVNALLLEILATLFWWLLSPNKKETKEIKEKKSIIKRFSPIKKYDTNQIVEAEENPEIVHAEIMNDEDTLLLGSDLTKIQDKNLANFKKSLFNNYQEMGSYVLFNNDIYEVSYEDLFLQNVTMFIRKNEILELEKPFYDKEERFKMEDMTIQKYVHRIFKNEQKEESFFKHRYALSITKNVIRGEADNSFFNIKNVEEINNNINVNKNIEAVEAVENKKTNNFDKLNIEDLLSKDFEINNDSDNEINVDIPKESEEVKEHEGHEEYDNGINNENFENYQEYLNLNEKNITPYNMLMLKDEKNMEENYFKFDINKPLEGKYKLIKKEKLLKVKDKMNASNYIDQFLGLNNKANKSSENDTNKRKVDKTIMDEVFPQKNKKIESFDTNIKEDFIDEKQVDFIQNIDSILDSLQVENNQAS